MKNIISACFSILIVLITTLDLFAGAGFYEDIGANQRQKVVFNFGNSDEWKSVVDEVDGQDYGTKTSSDIWILKGGEAFVWKDNGSDITSVILHYSVYKDGGTPVFSDINLPWAQDYSGTNNQRWASTSENIDILENVNSSGLWYVEFYYSAATNGVDCPNTIYFNNGGSNYKLHFTADQSLRIANINFDVVKKLTQNIIKLKVLNGVDISKVQIERSSNINQWTKLKVIDFENENLNQTNYQFEDNNPLPKAFYRLRIIYKYGIFELSNVIYIENENTFLINKLYPNPNKGNFTIDVKSPVLGYKRLVLINSSGEIVYFKKLNDTQEILQYEVNINNLQEGIYTLIIEQNNRRVKERIFISK